jgi:DNA-binding MarR family transcriptional regulator
MVTRTTPSQAQSPASKRELAAKDAMAEGMSQYLAVLPSADPKAAAAILALFRANQAQYLSNCRASDSVGLPIAVTGKRLAILRTLYFAPEKQMTLSGICRIVHLSPAAATNYVDALSRGSLVRRFANPEDRRVNVVQLTARGDDAFVKIAAALAASWTDACASFSEEEKDILVRLLKRLSA